MVSKLNRNLNKQSTTLNISQGLIQKPSITNTSSARKFAAKDLVDNSAIKVITAKSNDDHIVNNGSNLVSLSNLAMNIAAVSKSSLNDTQTIISQIRGNTPPDTRASLSHISDIQNFNKIQTDNIINSIIPNNTIADNKIKSLVQNILPIKSKAFIRQSNQDNTSVFYNTDIPQLDYVTVDVDRNKGVVDCFFARLTFSLNTSKISNGNIQAVRIFRSIVGEDQGNNIKSNLSLSISGVDRIKSTNRRSSSKNQDYLSAIEHSLRSTGVENAITKLISVDPLQNIRVGSISGSSVSSTPLAVISNFKSGKQADLAPFLVGDQYVNLDKSVINNLLFLRNEQIQNPNSSVVFTGSLIVGKNILLQNNDNLSVEDIRQTQNNFLNTTLVNGAAQENFKQIAFLTLDKLGRNIGESTEYFYDDSSVLFGSGYRYYIVTVDKNMNESIRSRIVQISIDGMRVPERPKNVLTQIIDNFVVMSIQVDDQFVEKFEIYRKELDEVTKKSTDTKTIADLKGYPTNIHRSNLLDNGFLHLVDVANGILNGGATFRDIGVKIGRRYKYRVYSVDIFGNKSESPFEFIIFVKDSSHKLVDLKKPNILAEVDISSQKAKITFSVDDDRIISFILSRRDVSINQQAFITPYGTNILRIGNRATSLSNNFLTGERITDATFSSIWTGYFPRLNSDQQVFIDKTSEIDRTYEYRIYGVDRFGNQSPLAQSNKLFILQRPGINSIINLTGEVSIDQQNQITGITLNWEDGNIDISPEDQVGNQTNLSDSSVRTLYQIERRKLTEDNWQEFPMIQETTFLDPVLTSNSISPAFRPEFVEKGLTYIYRIQSYQTGNFISNFSEPLQIFVDSPVLSPLNFSLKVPDTKIKPFYIMLNWDDDPSSGVEDKWNIERAIINNLAASTLNTKSISDISNLDFKIFRSVFKESSRFQSKQADNAIRATNNLITGQNHFMDNDVVFGNTYFYRIQSVSINGDVSDWVVKAIRIADDSQNIKQNSIISDSEKIDLTNSLVPLKLKYNSLSVPLEKNTTSFSMVPNFSTPSIVSTILNQKPTTEKFPAPSIVLLKQTAGQSAVENLSTITTAIKPSIAVIAAANAKQAVLKPATTIVKASVVSPIKVTTLKSTIVK